MSKFTQFYFYFFYLEKAEDPDPLEVELGVGFNDHYFVARSEEEEQVPKSLLLMQLEPVGVRLRR